ncbi:MAG: hypothetical protein IH795_13210 [Bacteroidetes bacterium]|nr:hypothetical protein [Bacteroidota bacterium]
MTDFIFTSESITEGHPDKIADQISDSVLDAIYEHDNMGRVACEVMVTTGMVLVAGEITTDTYVDIPTIVRNCIKEIGYTDASMGFDFETCSPRFLMPVPQSNMILCSDSTITSTHEVLPP